MDKGGEDTRSEREQLIWLATQLRDGERWEDMWGVLLIIVGIACGEKGKGEGEEEGKGGGGRGRGRGRGEEGVLSYRVRSLFSGCVLNWVRRRRESLRVLEYVKMKEERKEGMEEGEREMHFRCLKEFKEKIWGELVKICEETIEVLEKVLIQSCYDQEKVFIYNLKVKLYGHLQWACPNPHDNRYAEQAENCYQSLSSLYEDFPPTNSLRLGLALSHSVQVYEMHGHFERAIQLAKEAYVGAMEGEEGELEEEGVQILRMIQDNLVLWGCEEYVEPKEEGGMIKGE